MSTPNGVIVVGASLAGLSVARELRARRYDGPLTIIGAETHLPYDRPPLSKDFLSGDLDIALIPGEDLAALEADWILGDPATTVTTGASGRHTVRTAADFAVDADVVVLATGARARRLSCQTRTTSGVHSLRTIDDARSLRDSLRSSQRLVVVGAGFIGAEVASSAKEMGLEVTIVESSPTPFCKPLGARIAHSCNKLHDSHGVRLLTGASVDHIEHNGRPRAVHLADGSRLPADCVVVAVGTEPNTEWLDRPDLLVDNGFRTDTSGRTTVDRIYALGDCAARYRPVLDRYQRIEHWACATDAAKTVAASISGTELPRPSIPYFWSQQYGHRLQFAGYRTDHDVIRIVEGDIDSGPFVAVYEHRGTPVAVFARDNARLFTQYRKRIEHRTASQQDNRAIAIDEALHRKLECGAPAARSAGRCTGGLSVESQSKIAENNEE
ncbi:NAD(P)H-nitrite reductase [Mycobacteroides abscessus subsp. massiliense]|uniref:NAD(P)/FAD-dependent oxidoreductase n=1 Tax=Mycobacteroides abscessus TaxID=36809 RepID=UPI0009A8422D|nr:FAD-dependent oxidoreductase [Mycobacteroides abscessus]SKH59485.1 NAD(P)H-nitrite reductase [Mycobacteroides abscessus subsp. massiliense]SKH93137.1 NAD(P)H-nitrite reductase [Mycobacteroides abscessus subsp. massiliense]SKI13292.1 NAD(P)H-nitrite reductase [Mycobacteroides abscessus subsp. massiliense]SKJ99541.1 NAD(P)H-nitrite reductase [Mycobacteroides abscessus subsp. massiliense]SKK28118.1 NAD(P)H-nitrite reductase [Mycobacteroides abscessus subsp. massiliense]